MAYAQPDYEPKPAAPASMTFVPTLFTCQVSWAKSSLSNASYEAEVYQGTAYPQKQGESKDSKDSSAAPDPAKATRVFRYEGVVTSHLLSDLKPHTQYWGRVRVKRPQARALAGTVTSEWTALAPFQTCTKSHHIECDGKVGRNTAGDLGVVPGDGLDFKKGIKGFDCKFKILSLTDGGYISVGLEPAEPERLTDEDEHASDHLGFADGIGYTNRGQIAKDSKYTDHGEAFRQGDIVGLRLEFGGPLQVSINGRAQKPIVLGGGFNQSHVAFSLGKKGDAIECVEFALL